MRKILFFGLLLLICIATIGQVNYNYRYWFDGREDKVYTGMSSSNKWTIDADVSELDVGFHRLYVQVDTSGVQSPALMRYFFKPLSNDVSVRYWFDNDYAGSNELNSSILDVSHLSEGLHTISVQANDNGSLSGVKTSWFIKLMSPSTSGDMTCVCLIDGDEYAKEKVSASGGLFHFDLDVANLSDGLHCLTYLLVSETGIATRATTSFFLKTPLGGNAITKWEYWTNGNDSVRHTQTLDVPQNPLQIISLLPVESSAIRSSCFEFRVEEQKPILYAKNDVNFRFYDKAGRITDVSNQYVDENVRQELNVDEILTLSSNTVTKVNRPADNEIKWYKFDAEEGELAEFCLSKACSIDVFTPSGDTFYSASGAESVVSGGGNLPETGTYYVAVHDMTAKTGTYLNLTFKLIDKYAVLSNTPKVSANTGVLFVDIYGNGMNHLDSVQMVSSEIIASTTYFNVINNNLSKMMFNFYDEVLPEGKYDLMLYFNDSLKNERDTLIVSNAIELQSPKSGEITVEVSQDYLWVSPYPVTIKIKNNGNTTYWGVPFCLAYNNPDNVANIKYENFAVLWSERSLALDDDHIYRVDSLLGTTEEGVYLPLVVGKLGPYEELELDLGFLLKDDIPFNLRAWCGTPWSEEQQSVKRQSTTRSLITPYSTPNVISGQCSNYPSAYEVIDAIDTVLPDGADAAIGVSRLVVGTGETIGSIEIALMHRQRQAEREAYGAAYDEYVAPYRAELPPIRHPLDILMDVLDIDIPRCDIPIDFSEYGRCGNNIPQGTTIDPARPCEPNEMHGYTSESGSKFINGSVTDVFYSIESENDPEIATAAAHTIIVTDTIDGRYHDLSTFAATKVTLGDVVMELDGEKEFVKTMDLRPRIDVIAQVELKYDENTGIAQWTVTSLDPMTMEPTQDVMQGALPVNDSEGNGIGFFDYDIKLKSDLPDGTEIMNRASIIFDIEEPIITPYWVNTVDTECPVSRIDTIECVSDTLVNLRFSGEDNRSGIWRYALYVQPGDDSDWFLAKENLEQDSCEYTVYPDINYGFCVVATDSAGNVEPKLLEREISYTGFIKGDANGDGVIDAQDVVLAINKYLGEEPKMNTVAADVVQDGVIDAQDVVGIQNLYLRSTMSLYSVKRQRRTIKTE